MTRTHFQCLECGGTYFDRQRDGAPYFHTCDHVLDPDAPLPGENEEDLRERVEREHRRDENLPDDKRERAENVKRRGRGRREVPEGEQPELPPECDRPPLPDEERDG